MCVDVPADVLGGANVASLVARLRPVYTFELEAVLCALVDGFRECICLKDRSGARVAGEMSSLAVTAVSVSSVLARIGVLGISTVISGRGGKDALTARPGASFGDAMLSRR